MRIIQTIVEFLIVAWAVFRMVKVLNEIRRLGEKTLPVPGRSATKEPPK